MRLQHLLPSERPAEHQRAAGSFPGAGSGQVPSSHHSWEGARCL